MIKIFGGEQKFVASLSNSPYAFVLRAMNDMDKRAWDFDAVKTLHEDKISFEALTHGEQMAFIRSLARVTLMDFAQMNRLSGFLSDAITANEVKILLQKQAHEELIHTRSYFYIIETVLSSSKIIEDLVHKDAELLRINMELTKLDEYLDDCTHLKPEELFALSCISNIFLEMVSFFTNFMWFAHLNLKTKKFSGTLATIKYIVKDELEHGMAIFIPILKKHCIEHNIRLEALKSEIVKIANAYLDQETAFSLYINGENGEHGINPKSVHRYIRYRINSILQLIGIDTINDISVYNSDNPFKHLEDILGITNKQRNDSFFSFGVTNYDNIKVSPKDINQDTYLGIK
jgi:ribonucleoside-diphosphate reductase beta chain